MNGLRRESRMNIQYIIDNHNDLLWSISHKYYVKGYSTEDKYQECITKLYEVLNTYNNKYSITTFIYNICKNHLITLNNKEHTTVNTNTSVLGTTGMITINSGSAMTIEGGVSLVSKPITIFGTGIANFSKNKAGKWSFKKFYYEPEFKGGNFGIETCAAR